MVGAPPNELLATDARIRLGRGGDLDLVPIRIEYIRRILNEDGELKGHVRCAR